MKSHSKFKKLLDKVKLFLFDALFSNSIVLYCQDVLEVMLFGYFDSHLIKMKSPPDNRY